MTGGLSEDSLLERIKNLEMELSSYKSYVAQSLPENKDFEHSDTNSSPRKSDRKTIRLDDDANDRKSEKGPKNNKLMKLIEDLTEKNRGLEISEQTALIKFEKEYQRKLRILEETNEIKKDLENQLALIMIENESLLKENQWRKEFNITNAKEIEQYTKEIKTLQRKLQELENGNANWRLKYENQELIKKNAESNPQFRQTYVDIMSHSKTDEAYKGRLSMSIKPNTVARFTERKKIENPLGNKRGGTQIGGIAEADNEEDETTEQQDNLEDNLADELAGLEEQPDFGDLEQRDGSDHEDAPFEDPGDGVYRASEFDNSRFTVADKNSRSSHINIGLTARNFQKSALPTIVEDEYYDPIKDKLRELKKQERDNKDNVIKALGQDNQEEEKDEQDATPEDEEGIYQGLTLYR